MAILLIVPIMEVLEPDLSKRKDIDKVIKEMNKIIENLDDFDTHL